MSYTIRRWLTVGGNMFDDSEKVKDADDAIVMAKKLCGIFEDIITDEIEQKIRELEPGDVMRIRKSYINFSMRIRRNKT